MPSQRKGTPRSADRHNMKTVSLRLEADRARVEEAARRAGMTVHGWLLAAIREKLDREDAAAAEAGGHPGRTEEA